MTHIFPETPNVSPLSDRSLKGLRPDLLHWFQLLFRTRTGTHVPWREDRRYRNYAESTPESTRGTTGRNDRFFRNDSHARTLNVHNIGEILLGRVRTALNTSPGPLKTPV